MRKRNSECGTSTDGNILQNEDSITNKGLGLEATKKSSSRYRKEIIFIMHVLRNLRKYLVGEKMMEELYSVVEYLLGQLELYAQQQERITQFSDYDMELCGRKNVVFDDSKILIFCFDFYDEKEVHNMVDGIINKNVAKKDKYELVDGYLVHFNFHQNLIPRVF